MLDKCKRLLKKIVALSVCIFMLAVLTSCDLSDLKNKFIDKDTAVEKIEETNDTENNNQHESPDDNENSTEKEENEEDNGRDEGWVDTIYNYFLKFGSTLFLKLRIVEIYENAFVRGAFEGKYLMIECEVIENLYDREIITDERVFIPIIATFDTTHQDLRDFLGNFDCFYMQLFILKRKYTEEVDGGVEISTKISPLRFDKFYFYPIEEGKVSLKPLNDFLEEHNGNPIDRWEYRMLEKYCYDGIPCEDFENNVRELPYD